MSVQQVWIIIELDIFGSRIPENDLSAPELPAEYLVFINDGNLPRLRLRVRAWTRSLRATQGDASSNPARRSKRLA